MRHSAHSPPTLPPMQLDRAALIDSRIYIILTLTNRLSCDILRVMEETVRKRRNRKGITAAILQNMSLPNPMGLADLARALGTSPSSVYCTIARLRREGRVAPSDRQAPAGPPRVVVEPIDFSDPKPAARNSISLFDKPISSWDASDLGTIDSLPILTADQRRKLLSAIGMRPSQGTSQVSALGKLDEMDSDAGRRVGPPVPLTEAEQIARLSRLMKAVGPQVTEKAKEAAFEPSHSQESAHSDQNGAASASPSNVA